MLKLVVFLLLVLNSGICFQDINVENIVTSTKASENPSLQASNYQSNGIDPPTAKTEEDPSAQPVTSEGGNKKPAPTVGLSPQQIDALAEKILQIHGVQPGEETPQNHARAERLKNVVANVETKLENKLKEVAGSINEDTLKETIGNELTKATENIDNTGDVIDNKDTNIDENNNEGNRQIKLDEQTANVEGTYSDKNNKSTPNNEGDIEAKPESIEDRQVNKKEEQELLEPLRGDTATNVNVDVEVHTNSQDNSNVESTVESYDQVKQDLNQNERITENAVKGQQIQETEINGTKEVTEALDKTEFIGNDGFIKSDTKADEISGNVAEKQFSAETQRGVEVEEHQTEDVIKESLQGTEEEIEGNQQEDEETDSLDILPPTLIFEEGKINPENETSRNTGDVSDVDVDEEDEIEDVTEDSTNETEEGSDDEGDVVQDAEDSEKISPTPTLQEANVDEEIEITRNISPVTDEEQVDETDLETCNTEESDCDRRGRKYLYSVEDNLNHEEQLESKTKNGYFDKILNFIYDRF